MKTVNGFWQQLRQACALPLDELFPLYLGLESGGSSLPDEHFSADPLLPVAAAIH